VLRQASLAAAAAAYLDLAFGPGGHA
jgi:hypothetical protein